MSLCMCTCAGACGGWKRLVGALDLEWQGWGGMGCRVLGTQLLPSAKAVGTAEPLSLQPWLGGLNQGKLNGAPHSVFTPWLCVCVCHCTRELRGPLSSQFLLSTFNDFWGWDSHQAAVTSTLLPEASIPYTHTHTHTLLIFVNGCGCLWGQTACGIWFFPSTVWALNSELRSSCKCLYSLSLLTWLF